MRKTLSDCVDCIVRLTGRVSKVRYNEKQKSFFSCLNWVCMDWHYITDHLWIKWDANGVVKIEGKVKEYKKMNNTIDYWLVDIVRLNF